MPGHEYRPLKKGESRINEETGVEVAPTDFTPMIEAVVDMAEQLATANGYPKDVEIITPLTFDLLSASTPDSPFAKTFLDVLSKVMERRGYVPTQEQYDRVQRSAANALGVPIERVSEAINEFWKPKKPN